MSWRWLIIGLLGLSLLGSSACSRSKRVSKSTQSRTSDVASRYARELGVSVSAIENERLYVFIDQWKVTPYQYGGTSTSGVDCSGFVGVLYQDVYSKRIPRTTTELSKSAKKVSTNNLQEGDLVFFDINGKKSSHVGVYLMNNKFVHASSSKGVIISDLLNPYYQSAFAKGGRL